MLRLLLLFPRLLRRRIFRKALRELANHQPGSQYRQIDVQLVVGAICIDGDCCIPVGMRREHVGYAVECVLDFDGEHGRRDCVTKGIFRLRYRVTMKARSPEVITMGKTKLERKAIGTTAMRNANVEKLIRQYTLRTVVITGSAACARDATKHRHSPRKRPQSDKVLGRHIPPFRKDVCETGGAQPSNQRPDDLDRVFDLEQRRGRSTAMYSETSKDPIQAHQELQGL